MLKYREKLDIFKGRGWSDYSYGRIVVTRLLSVLFCWYSGVFHQIRLQYANMDEMFKNSLSFLYNKNKINKLKFTVRI